MKKLMIIFALFLLIGCSQKIAKESEMNLDADLVEIAISKTDNLDNTIKNSNVIAIQDIEKHDTVNDCWIVYEGNVYDVSNWESTSLTKEIQYYCGDEISAEWLIKNNYGDKFIQTIEAFGTLKGEYSN